MNTWGSIIHSLTLQEGKLVTFIVICIESIWFSNLALFQFEGMNVQFLPFWVFDSIIFSGNKHWYIPRPEKTSTQSSKTSSIPEIGNKTHLNKLATAMLITSVSWLGLTSMCHFHPNIACSCETGQSKFVAVSNDLALEGTDLSRIKISIPGIVKVSCLAANL